MYVYLDLIIFIFFPFLFPSVMQMFISNLETEKISFVLTQYQMFIPNKKYVFFLILFYLPNANKIYNVNYVFSQSAKAQIYRYFNLVFFFFLLSCFLFVFCFCFFFCFLGFFGMGFYMYTCLAIFKNEAFCFVIG